MSALPTVDRLVTQQACVEEARALLGEAAIALSRISLIKPMPDSEPMVTDLERRAVIFHKRAMVRLQEVFYSDDEVPSA